MSMVTETSARPAEGFRVTRSRRNVAWTAAGSVIVVVVLFIALLVSYPWVLLTIGTVAYLASLPLGWWSRERYRQADAALADAPAAGNDRPVAPQREADDERPARLN